MSPKGGFSGILNELSDTARQNLAESSVYGEVPRRKLNIRWNEMSEALEKRDYDSFVRISRDVQSMLVMVLHKKKWKERERIKRYMGVARNAVNGSIRKPVMASRILEKIKKIVEDSGEIHLAPLVVRG